MIRIVTLLYVCISWSNALTLGEKTPLLSLSGSDGGYVTNSAFNSSVFDGAISIITVVDPDQGDDGKALNAALLEARLSGKVAVDVYQSFVIIDMASTWKPNWIISNALEEKQKKYPLTRFIKDLKGITNSSWDISKDSYSCIIVNEHSEVLYSKKAPFSQEDINIAVSTVIENTKRLTLKKK